MCVCACVCVWAHTCLCILSCVWLFVTPIGCNPSGSSVHRIFQARIEILQADSLPPEPPGKPTNVNSSFKQAFKVKSFKTELSAMQFLFFYKMHGISQFLACLDFGYKNVKCTANNLYLVMKSRRAKPLLLRTFGVWVSLNSWVFFHVAMDLSINVIILKT